MLSLPAYILAGGRSSRFGSDKAVFEDDGIPLWQRVAVRLQAAGCTVHLVGRSPRGLPIPEIIEEEHADHHPLWGVACALRDARIRGHEWAVTAPCDLVDLEEIQVSRLIMASRTLGPLGDAAASAHPVGAKFAKGQPLFAVLPVEAFADASELATSGRSMRDFHARWGTRAVDVGALRNLNTRPT